MELEGWEGAPKWASRSNAILDMGADADFWNAISCGWWCGGGAAVKGNAYRIEVEQKKSFLSKQKRKIETEKVIEKTR